MPRSNEQRDPSTEVKPSLDRQKSKIKLTREILYLAEQAADGKIKVLPSDEWSLHYPVDQVTRAEKLQGLLEGRYTAEEIESDIKPDALLYDIRDIERDGLEKVTGRIRDLSSYVNYYDYSRFAQFVESMRGHDIPMETIDRLYGDITQTRVQKRVMDSFGHTGVKQMEQSLLVEAEQIIQGIDGFSRYQKVLKALKLNWLSEDLGLVPQMDRDRAVASLSGDERKLYEELQSSYREYIQTGDEAEYQNLVDKAREGLPKVQRGAQDGEVSDNMKDLEQELEKFREEVVPPGSPEDPAIPPEDEDEYHTPQPSSGESKEKMQERPIFEIEPALGGHFASGRKSYYDVDSKTWSKKKQLSPYNAAISGGKRFNISGAIDDGFKSLPLPNGYALDASSLKTMGANIEIKRDQNGCFYLEVIGNGTFSVDFLLEEPPFLGQTISEDTAPIYRGLLSQKTEAVISKLKGSPLLRAEQARQYILANHFYPGGGDLESAQALQYKLRSESNGDNYLQNIDNSEYLECYSANTLFISLIRKAGVPARLVVGHMVEGAKDGKSAITQNTGHAWSEVWDGKTWRRFDATPAPKPEDKKDSEQDSDQEKKDPAPKADDGGVDKPQEKDSNEDRGDEHDQQQQSSEPSSGNPLDQISDASDSEMQESESELQEAKEQMEEVERQNQELNEKVQEAKNFKDLDELQKELEQSDLFDDLKEEIEAKLEAKEDQMKSEIENELDKMVDDGFMDEEERDRILDELEKRELEELDRVQKAVEQENKLYNEYEDIREEIMPLVDQWLKYFTDRLPKKEEPGFDEDSLTRQGSFDRRAVMVPRNLIFGTVKNPRQIKESVEPRFMASILVDVSGSMRQGNKLKNARKLLVFYSELFSAISQQFGYIRFSIDIFSDSVTRIKEFDQDYDSSERYDFGDNSTSTVKVRLMKKIVTAGGTNMLDGIKKAAEKLNEQITEYPDYASSLYFVGDGGDTCGNDANIRSFLRQNEEEGGFGEHMYSAILLGDESQRRELEDIFGEDHTNVAPDFDELIEMSMEQFDENIEDYLRTMT